MRVMLVDADPRWPEIFRREADRLRAALGSRVLAIEHVGSTAVPGLAAKPIVDVLLVVKDDAAMEASDACAAGLAAADLERHGPALWKRVEPAVHVHVRAPTSPDVARWIAFRDRLRSDAGDRALYLAEKKRLAERDWPRARAYAEAKDAVIADILTRA